MGKKPRARRRTRKVRGNPFPLVGAGLLTLSLAALEYWQLFLWCALGAGTCALCYLAYKIARWIYGRKRAGLPETGIMRDSRYISPELRHKVWVRDMGRCVECQSQTLLEYDHIIPISKGGATSYENLQILCRTCNRQKSDRI